MKELESKDSLKIVEEALTSHKIDMFLFMQYDQDKKAEDFDPNLPKVGFIATVESEDVTIEGTLSRNGNVLVAFTSYSEFLNILENPRVLKLEMCWDTELLLSNKSEEIVLTNPVSGPVGDEWDSPSYDSFWHPVELAFQKKIERLERIGKKVKVL
ncbi:MAG: hypothetical protein NT162_01045 [Candidatus Woesebacteria bacterium]|nr:hypothetical protein [Candidatus Woesebacteria bacterium]